MTTPTPTHLDPMPCEDSTLECFACGTAIVALVPLALWAVAHPALAVVVVATIVVMVVTVMGLVGRDLPNFEREE